MTFNHQLHLNHLNSTQPNLYCNFHKPTLKLMKQNGTTIFFLIISLSMGIILMNLPSLPSVPLFFFLFSTIINQSLSARILSDPSPTHHLVPRSITFYVHNLLAQPSLSPSPFTTKVLNNQIPFPKPLGFFPPARGIPLPEYPNPNIPTQTLDLPGIGISFPARATFQELELGTVLVIDEDLFQGEFGSVFVGKAQGMYVASSEDGSSHMMAMTVSFVNGEYRDGLRFFGVHRRDDDESHVAVIGGTGKYENANGYATIKTMNLRSSRVEKERRRRLQGP